ncbi:MarR family winged helix-turn-helix transcriptional regulator [Nocardiopsis lambiniae]|uniref:MarR family winged helix-turn-helix transcriptional regulator n=1 Tax=Nocardiopsis lambiniae TaxID=3075539 RepID=A0ABU2MCP3_9ACTN|nr:MarR family winged helix-turn-helix transcriptional regulator [Nocardiopsis sp. DSM 44743]MDT0329691.1 MarR family winged helix-turn-helix transcriptional regulator [Nocardiopsis sp. DSM 44743]
MSTENSRPEPPALSTSILVLTLARQVEGELGAALAPLDLTVARLGLLGHISGMPGISFSELARMSGITVQSAHTGVKALVAAGWVRDLTARPGAASTIEITPEGKRLLERAGREIARIDERLFGSDADPIRHQVGTAIRAAFAGIPRR